MLDTATGRRRTWTTGGASILGHIVWAADGCAHVTSTFPRKPREFVIHVVSGRPQRHACLNGLDAFGRTDDGAFGGGSALYGVLPCGSADAY